MLIMLGYKIKLEEKKIIYALNYKFYYATFFI